MNRHLLTALFSLLLAAPLSAATLTGTVTNRTTGKPAAGDDVLLLRLAGTMEETARTRTDVQGRFRLEFSDEGGPHLVRVNHQGVNYHKPAPPGTTSAEVDVYDVAKKVNGIGATVNVRRFQATETELQVVELYAVKNDSRPPRTQMSDRNFEIYLPEGASIETSVAAGPGGMPVNSAPVPLADKGRYAFLFPLRPGETRFQVAYRLPYSGEISVQARLVSPVEHVVVMTPKSMNFSAPSGASFQSSLEDPGMNVYVSPAVAAGGRVAFRISGTGAIPREGAQVGAAAEAENRPGGGLGRPIEKPDPLHDYRWYILGGLAGVLVWGGFYVMNRAPLAAPPRAGSAPSAASGSESALLAALKEELFELEAERAQGRIPQADYEKAKAALDITLQRALRRRGAQKSSSQQD